MAEAKTQATDVEGSAVELSVDTAVVSLSAIAAVSDKLEGVRRVTVRKAAVVTPAVRDLLRQRNIELAYRTDKDAKPKNRDDVAAAVIDAPRLIVGVAEASNQQVDLLLRLLARASVAVQRLAPASLLETIDDLARQLAGPATIGLLLTSEPAAAVCLSNRLAGLRAMAAGDAETMSALGAAARAIGANLLIVDPAGRGPFVMKQLIDRFCQGAPRACPPQWRGRLD
jgi:hypothetical protein